MVIYNTNISDNNINIVSLERLLISLKRLNDVDLYIDLKDMKISKFSIVGININKKKI
jgi:hypothetical protein